MRSLFLIPLLIVLSGCGQFIASAKKDFADNLSATILESDDPDTIAEAIPTFLVLNDSLLRGDRDNVGLLLAGSRLYGAYGSVFIEESSHRKLLADKAYALASRAICISIESACDLETISFAETEKILDTIGIEHIDALFTLGTAWAGLIQANSGDWNAVADLPKVRAIITRVLALDEAYSGGDAHLYMGVMQSFLPPAMGGKPDIAKQHFTRAIELSAGKNLMAQLLYAEKYARLVFDKNLHDGLLRQVIDADLEVSDRTLINTIAKKRAAILLSESDDFF